MQISEMLQKICIRNLVQKYCRGVTPERKVQVTNAWDAHVQAERCLHTCDACKLPPVQAVPSDSHCCFC